MAEKDDFGGAFAHQTTEVASGERSRDRARSGELPADWRPAFDPDVVLGDRYRVVRFLARGGMGEVYEAEDLVLRMRVALKSIAPELVVDAEMMDRLKQEVLLARKVTHPNVCRLHDLGFHVGPRGTSAFLTMDLLRGDTLAAHIARKGRLSATEALPIVRQLVAALDAAHDAGVIHRDFKSRNVMLATGTGSAPTRAVVMDFGIALATEDEEHRALDEGRFIGTPAYMAPEQVQGGAITRATDVYALGVVMFEMVTGTLPFEAERAIDVISMRLTTPPPSPRARVSSLDSTWNDVILRCLAREPAQRFQSASEVLGALEASGPWRARRWIVAGATISIALAVAALAWNRARKSPAVAGEPARRPTLAVVMKDQSARDDARWLATALAETIGTELDADEALRVIPGDRVARARRDLAIADDVLAAKPSLARLRENLGTDYVVVGTYVAQGDGTVRVDVALDDARTGKTLARASSHGATARLFELAMPLAESIRKELGARDPSAAQIAQARIATAGNAAAARAYAEGRAKYAESDYAGALASFEQAAAADPGFPLAHEGLASAASALGYDARALEEARKAFDLSHDLPRADQLAIEGRYRATAKDWDRAVAIERALVEFYPDNVDYGIHYVHSLVAAGRAKEGLVEIDRLHALPPPGGNDARVDLYEAIASSKISDFKRRLAAARRAVEKAERTGELSVLADGHDQAGDALLYLHRPDEALLEIEKAHVLYVRLHDRKYEAGSLQALGRVQRARGDAQAALPLHEEALAILREVGARYDVAGGVSDVAEDEWLVGDEGKARARFEETRGLYEAIHDREGIGNALEGLALVFEDDGDLARAKESAVEGRALSRAVDARDSVVTATVHLAELAAKAGDPKAAAIELAEAESMSKELESDYDAACVKLGRARIARDQGELAAARRGAEEARAAFIAAQEMRDVHLADVVLARVALADGRLSDADPLARAAADAAHAGGLKNDEASAIAALALVLVAESKSAEASAVLDRASALAPTRVEAELELAIAHARMLESSPEGAAQARSLLAATIKRAEGAGFVALAREARRPLSR